MTQELTDRIKHLKQARNAIILAHNYQIDEVQDIADFVGDSFGLSQQAAATGADVIVFCGVHFMAESAAILAPTKTVLLPDKYAGCPLAETITAEDLEQWKKQYPNAAVVCYVNSSAAVKAISDVCCTSSNAVKVIQSLEQEQILFLPDRNLGNYVARFTEKEIICWDGCCVTHQRVKPEDVQQARAVHPDAVVVVHPECRPEVVNMADHVDSTTGILRFVGQSTATKFIIGTEMGIMHRLKNENPGKEFYLLSQGLVCPNMKKTNLMKVEQSLAAMEPVITVDADIRERAVRALERMLAVQ